MSLFLEVSSQIGTLTTDNNVIVLEVSGSQGPAGSDATVNEANVTSVVTGLGTATSLVDGDLFNFINSVGTWVDITWANIVVAAKSFFSPRSRFVENAIGNTSGTLTMTPATNLVYSATATAAVTLAVDTTGVPTNEKWTITLYATNFGAFASGYPASWEETGGTAVTFTASGKDKIFISGTGTSGTVEIGALNDLRAS